MNPAEMRKYILQAAEYYSTRELDVAGKGKAIKKIKDGKPVTTPKLQEIIARISALPSPVFACGAKIAELEARVKKLTEQVNQLATIPATIPPSPPVIPNPILAASRLKIVTRITTTNGRKYKKYYACGTIRKKQRWIYLGNSPENAEEKIKIWLKKNISDNN